MQDLAAKARLRHLTSVEWLICTVASIGFAFDTYEILALTLMVRPALGELLATTASPAIFNRWVGLLFYVPAIAGGVFGLLGGYLIDLLGRRRILLWSVLLFGICTFATAYANTPLQFLIYRCGTFVGVSVEFVAATAWLAELFTQREQREAILGYTQGFASTGGLLVSAAYYLAVTYGPRLPAVHGGHEAWRYTAISGLFPAIPLILLRPFLPESPIWKKKKAEGTLQRPSILALFEPAFRKTALLTCLMMACSYAASFGMLQHFARIIPRYAQPQNPVPRRAGAAHQRLSRYSGNGRIGWARGHGLFSCARTKPQATAAYLPGSGPALDSVLCCSGPLCEMWICPNGAISHWGCSPSRNLAFGEIICRSSIPPTSAVPARASQPISAGACWSTSAALIVTSMVTAMPGGTPTRQLAYAAGIVGFLAYAVGFIASFWLPEPSLAVTPD